MSLALFTICLISQMHGSEAVGGQCKTSERSVPGKALKGHTFKEFAVRAIVECQNTCERDPRCASYNFYIPGKVCELNSHTKEEKPNHFVTDELRFYMKREGTNYVELSTPNTLNWIPRFSLLVCPAGGAKLESNTGPSFHEVLRDTQFQNETS